jgi:hypothetical protein
LSQISCHSRILGLYNLRTTTIYAGSDFGDVFPYQPSKQIIDWVHQSGFARRDDESSTIVELGRGKQQEIDWDSDEDLEVEIVQALLEQGLSKLAFGDMPAAETSFQDAHGRLKGRQWSQQQATAVFNLKFDTNKHLLDSLIQQKKWAASQSLLRDKLEAAAAMSPSVRNRDTQASMIRDSMLLSQLLIHTKDYQDARLHARGLSRTWKDKIHWIPLRAQTVCFY